MRTAPLLILAVLVAAPASAGPMEDRNAAFDVLAQRATVERKLSNCRWIRGVRDDALSARWRRDNSTVVESAMAVIDAQGGLTPARARTVEGLAEINMGDATASRDGCRTYLEETRRGGQDLTVLVQPHLLKQVLGYVPPKGEPVIWTVEQRRQPTGVLAYSAKPWHGDGGIAACETATAARPHIFLRRQVDAAMQPVTDPDPDMWYAECVGSPVDPVTGAAPRGPA